MQAPKNQWQRGPYIGQGKCDLIRLSSDTVPPYNRHHEGEVSEQWIDRIVTALNEYEAKAQGGAV